jgi:dynein heavy chain
MIRMPDGPRDYDTNFRIYLTTKLANPHYTPEISTKVCLLNFMITPDGLGDQMLGLTVAKEFPALAAELRHVC